MRFRILIADPIDPAAVERLKVDHDVTVLEPGDRAALETAVADADALVVRSGVEVTAAVIAAAPDLRVIARAGAGTDNIDLDACRAAGIAVFNLPGASANAVAEHALALMLALARRLPEADRAARTGQPGKAALAGIELGGRTLGVIGCGAIGTRIAALAAAFGMTVLATVAHPSRERDLALADQGIHRANLDVVLAAADIACVAVPLTPATRGMIGCPELELLGPDGYLVNVARGDVIDARSLQMALAHGRIAGAALDVWPTGCDPAALAATGRALLTPHLGAQTAETQHRLGRDLTDRLNAALAGEAVPDRVC